MKAVLVLFVLNCTLCLVLASGMPVCGYKYHKLLRFCKDNLCYVEYDGPSCIPLSVYNKRHAGQCDCCISCLNLLPKGAACKMPANYTRNLGQTLSETCSQPDLNCIDGYCVPRA